MVELSLPHDSGRAVLEEKLHALGLKFWMLTGSDNNLEEKFKTIGEELGFVEGTRQSFLSDFGEMEPKVSQVSSPDSARRSDNHRTQDY